MLELVVLVVIEIDAGVYLQYDCHHRWGKSHFALIAKITAVAGDGVEALFLLLLDFYVRRL